ncbi:helix-turn-helix transcriptional regulator [Ralstonia holmesii]|uniref:helix-turn-helix transcriptional regulator n=1 Tax=Ralstonia holmesii TaxID=3058602 RepID=UPI003F6BC3D4
MRPINYLDLHSVAAAISLSETSVQQLVREDAFPKPRKISARRVGWLFCVRCRSRQRVARFQTCCPRRTPVAAPSGSAAPRTSPNARKASAATRAAPCRWRVLLKL